MTTLGLMSVETYLLREYLWPRVKSEAAIVRKSQPVSCHPRHPTNTHLDLSATYYNYHNFETQVRYYSKYQNQC
jgi:hypothetical protein